MFNNSRLTGKAGRRRAVTLFLCFTLVFSVVNFIQQTAYAATDYYVATTGSDTNPGTQERPFLTILKASQVATPGTTVHVAPGTYTGGFRTLANGTETNRIRYISDTKWGARIVPPPSNTTGYIWDNQGDYVDIDGFDIDGNGSDTRQGIYTTGTYTAIKNNHVHHIATNIACTGSGGAGINTDYWTYGVQTEVTGNVLHNIGYEGCNFIQGIYISTSAIVKNNLAYDIGGAAIHLWHDANNVTIANNTVFSSQFGIIVGGGDYHHTTGPADNVHVSNNIVYNNLYGISEQGSTGINNSYTNNLVYQNSIYNLSLNNDLTDSGTISADPQFVYDPGTGGGDYHLKSTSPAIDAGSPIYAPSVDLDGSARPMGAGNDIGAYEYSPDSFTLNAVSKMLKIGDTTQLISSTDLSGATYVSDNPNVATVNSSGLVTATGNGTANITATVTNGTSSRISTLQISVAVRLHSLTLQTSEPNPEVGQTQLFTLSGLMSDGSAAVLNNATIRYYMNSRFVASVNSAGLVTGLSSGTDLLHVEVMLDGVIKRTSTSVTVDPPSLASVALTAPKYSLVKGQLTPLTVTGTANNGKTASLNTATIAYRSGNPAIASVNGTGLVTAVAPGTAEITVDVTFNGQIFSATRIFAIQPGISVIYPFATLPIVSKTAGTILYAPTLQFEAATEGPSITFSLNVPETHLYQLSLKSFKATSYGNYAIKIDGQLISEYNFYGSTGRGTTFEPIGSAVLTQGIHQITFENIGKNPESSNYKMGIIELELLAPEDSTPPTTTAAVYGAVNNGWYTSDVTLSLTASDNLTGVARTEYQINNGDWIVYSGDVNLVDDGNYTINYRSTDLEGNIENNQTVILKLDQTNPALTIQLNKTTIWPPNHKMVAIHAVLNSSDAGSGVASVILTSISSNEPDGGNDDIHANIGSTDTSFSLRAERAGSGTGRIYTITYTATDHADNQTIATTTVTVPHDQSGHHPGHPPGHHPGHPPGHNPGQPPGHPPGHNH
jgi:hypothetical protein